jgi:hypothetical protein
MKVFISHSSYDKWIARQMSRLLEQSGHTTFLDEKDIKTGDSIDTAIQIHLKDADHLLILLSPASIKSHWVFIELGGAKALGKRVIPILFHVAANEIPSAISQLLARDINEFDKYISELAPSTAPTKKQPTSRRQAASVTKDTSEKEIEPNFDEHTVLRKGKFGDFKIGDKVTIVQVERLTDEDKDSGPKWVSSMDKYSGLQTRITGFFPSGNIVKIAADDEEFWWDVSWLSRSSLSSN